MARSIESLAFRIWVRRWSSGHHDCTMQVLDNAMLFPKWERGIIQAVNTAVPKGGVFAETLERLRENGRDDTALELEELSRSVGSSNPDTFRRHFEKMRRPVVAEELRKLSERLAHNGTSTGIAHAEIQKLFRYEIEIREQTAEKEEDGIMWNDPATEPPDKTPEPIVDNLLYPGLTFVSGLWKQCMKTTIVTALIQHVATGLPFLDRQVRQRRCAFVQLDTPIPGWLTTARELRAGMSIPDYAILGWRRPLDLTQTADQERLAAWCEAEKIELLAIDALSSVFRGNENDAELVKPVLRGFLLEVLRDRLGTDLIILSHPNRAGTSKTRGSGEWEAAADSLWALTAKMKGDLTESVTISITGRHPYHRLAVTFDWPQPGCPGIRIREITDEKPIPRAHQVVAALTDDWQSTLEIRIAANCNHANATKELVKLLGEGYVERQDHPTRSGDQWRRKVAEI